MCCRNLYPHPYCVRQAPTLTGSHSFIWYWFPCSALFDSNLLMDPSGDSLSLCDYPAPERVIMFNLDE